LPDLQRTVDEVRFRLQSGDCELNNELKRLAGDYAALCHEANLRLRRCGEFLKQGQRAGAIHLAEAAPNLLEAFATLDFPERAEWDEIVGLYQLSPAEPLLADVAQELNEAYTTEQPLEKLYDLQRLLALSRAPLNQRLAVVRKLAEADPASRFREEDVRAFERARCKEIEEDAQQAAARNDDDALLQLLTEITSGPWQSFPSPAIVQSVRKLTSQVIAEELGNAYVRRNLDRARALRERWQQVTPKSQASGNGLTGNVAAALKWLAAEDSKSQSLQAQYERLAALEKLVADPDASLAELETARQFVLKLRRDIPEPLSGRVHERMRTMKEADSSSRRRVGGALAAGTVVVIVLIAFIAWTNVRHSSAQRIAASAEEFVTRGNLRQARQLLHDNAWMSSTEPYLKVNSLLVEAEQKEEARVASFEGSVKRARSAPTPQQADSALAEADRLALTSDERRIVDDLRETTKLRTQQVARNDDNLFQQELSELNDLLDRLEELHRKSGTDAAFADLLKSAEKKLGELRVTSSRVKPALSAHVDAAEARLARIQKAMSNFGARSGLLERLTTESLAISDRADPLNGVGQFARTLVEFSEQFPTDSKSVPFVEAARDAELWQGIARWQSLTRKWSTLLPRTVKEARGRAAECRSWLQDFAAAPPAPLIREYLSFLGAFASREEDSSGDAKEGLREKLLDLFSGPLVEGAEMFVTAAGERYYLRAKYEWAEGKPLKYIAGVRGEQKPATIKQAEVANPESREAPQSIIRRRVREILVRTTLSNWDDGQLEIAELLRSDRDLDPFLRFYFLLRVLEISRDGNSFLAAEFEPLLQELRGAGVNLAVRWMEPKDSDSQAARRSAQTALAAVKPLKDLFDRSASRRLEFQNQLFETVSVAGWLATEPPGQWECRSKAAPKANALATCWAVVRDPGLPEARWVKIGERNSANRIAVAAESRDQLLEGRLLFVRSRPIPE
jgi:hypothetical protein